MAVMSVVPRPLTKRQNGAPGVRWTDFGSCTCTGGCLFLLDNLCCFGSGPLPLASGLSPEVWQLPGGPGSLAHALPTNCPFCHGREIKDAGCHLLTPRPPAVRGEYSHCAGLPRPEATHAVAFFFRTLDLKSPVLQQVLERQNEVLCVLTQKIVTTQKCVISEHVQIEDKCGGMMGIQTKTVQVRTGGAEARATGRGHSGLSRSSRGPWSGSSLGGAFIHQDSV